MPSAGQCLGPVSCVSFARCEPSPPQPRLCPEPLEDPTRLDEERLCLVAASRFDELLGMLELGDAQPVGHLELAKQSGCELEAVVRRFASACGELGAQPRRLRF